MKIIGLFSSVILLLSSNSFSATYVAGVETVIIAVNTYQYDSASGDISIQVRDTVTGCEAGYFMLEGTKGLEEGLSVALSAFHSGSRVVVGGQSGIQWSATGRTDYCQVHAISLVK